MKTATVQKLLGTLFAAGAILALGSLSLPTQAQADLRAHTRFTPDHLPISGSFTDRTVVAIVPGIVPEGSDPERFSADASLRNSISIDEPTRVSRASEMNSRSCELPAVALLRFAPKHGPPA